MNTYQRRSRRLNRLSLAAFASGALLLAVGVHFGGPHTFVGWLLTDNLGGGLLLVGLILGERAAYWRGRHDEAFSAFRVTPESPQ
jgi:hypothetical protein